MISYTAEISPRKLQSSATDPAFYQSVGKAIELSRRYQDKSRRQLAQASGISYSYLSEIETGKKGPSAEALLAIAQALGLTPSELLGTAESWLSGSERPAASIPSASNRTQSLSLPMDSAAAVFRNPQWLRSRQRAVAHRAIGRSTGYNDSETDFDSDRNTDLKRAEQLLEAARGLSPEAREALITQLRNLRP